MNFCGSAIFTLFTVFVFTNPPLDYDSDHNRNHSIMLAPSVHTTMMNAMNLSAPFWICKQKQKLLYPISDRCHVNKRIRFCCHWIWWIVLSLQTFSVILTGLMGLFKHFITTTTLPWLSFSKEAQTCIFITPVYPNLCHIGRKKVLLGTPG
jgi:hypothetical protein